MLRSFQHDSMGRMVIFETACSFVKPAHRDIASSLRGAVGARRTRGPDNTLAMCADPGAGWSLAVKSMEAQESHRRSMVSAPTFLALFATRNHLRRAMLSMAETSAHRPISPWGSHRSRGELRARSHSNTCLQLVSRRDHAGGERPPGVFLSSGRVGPAFA